MEETASSPLAIALQPSWLRKLVMRFTGLDQLAAYYARWLRQQPFPSASQAGVFLDFVLDSFGVSVDWQQAGRLQQIPRSGPLLVVSNHPLGAMEGMLLTRALLRIRPDVKVLANRLLLRFPEFREVFIGVDVLTDTQRKANALALIQASRHLEQGGVLVMFPAGTVGQQNQWSGRVSDRPWNKLAGYLCRRHRCACLPFYVRAHNRRRFYLSGLIHKRLRTALLAREMLAKCNQRIPIAVGRLVEYAELAPLGDDDSRTQYLRTCCKLLGADRVVDTDTEAVHKPLAANLDPALIRRELSRLESRRLLQMAGMSLYCAPYAELGPVMEQIAISRERTFRAVSEGTGQELDLDHFDPYYWHLWAWDDEAGRLVGGYRLGKVDEIIAAHGLQALYSYSLYHYDKAFIKRLGRSIEVGRSFVTPEYQRHTRVLDLLWRGIGRFMLANPDDHTLFGCVSVSREYSPLAQAFIEDIMRKHFTAAPEYIHGVKAKTPLRVAFKPWSEAAIEPLSNIPVINKLLGRIDSGKTIPILIRHYLALNGRFVSFTLNTGFNDSLDGLIIVDLRKTPERYLARYMGKQRAKQFLNKWKQYESVA